MTKLIDYEAFCGFKEERRELELGSEISAPALKQVLDRAGEVVLLDVREPFEHQICRIEGSKLIPLGQLRMRVNELDPADDIVVYCHTGVRSAQAAKVLKGLGFSKVTNLKGGIRAWTIEVDPSLRSY